MTPAATLKLLNDATVDLDDWITKEVSEAVALQEGRDFRSGNGVNQPKSFLSYDAVLGKRMELGGVGYITIGFGGSTSTPSRC